LNADGGGRDERSGSDKRRMKTEYKFPALPRVAKLNLRRRFTPPPPLLKEVYRQKAPALFCKEGADLRNAKRFKKGRRVFFFTHKI